MRLPGGWEWIIILVVILLLFGPGRLSRIAGELGRGIREFREGIKDSDDEKESEEAPEGEKDSDQI